MGNMKELYAATKEGCEQYLEENLGSVPVKSKSHNPLSSSTPVNESTPTIPLKLSSNSTIPSDMPSLAIVKGLTACQSGVPHVLWSQDHQSLLLRVSITSMREWC